jgi:hypothetical protein
MCNPVYVSNPILLIKDVMIKDVINVSDDTELEENIRVGSPTMGELDVGEMVREENEPEDGDDHIVGQTALREDRKVKTRLKLKYNDRITGFIYESKVQGQSEIRTNMSQCQDNTSQWEKSLLFI